MGIEVLRPHDAWNQRLDVVNRAIFPSRRYSYSNTRINRKPANRPVNDRTKQRFVSSKALSLASNFKTKNNHNLNLGHVTILKRGESPEKIKNVEKDSKNDSLVVQGMTKFLGQNRQEMLQEQIRDNNLKMSFSQEGIVRSVTYAGSAFAMSPAPSSLPVPSFSKKKEISPILVDSATRDLRRLLRLEIVLLKVIENGKLVNQDMEASHFKEKGFAHAKAVSSECGHEFMITRPPNSTK